MNTRKCSNIHVDLIDMWRIEARPNPGWTSLLYFFLTYSTTDVPQINETNKATV